MNIYSQLTTLWYNNSLLKPAIMFKYYLQVILYKERLYSLQCNNYQIHLPICNKRLKVLTSPSDKLSYSLSNLQSFRLADQTNKQSLRLINSISKDHQIIINFARRALNITQWSVFTLTRLLCLISIWLILYEFYLFRIPWYYHLTCKHYRLVFRII